MSKDYNATVNLPKTDFPMRASLPKREPDMLKAKRYVTDAAINNDLETLKSFGEFENNDFAAEELVL